MYVILVHDVGNRYKYSMGPLKDTSRVIKECAQGKTLG